jgi:hypothetical protein
MIAPRSAYLMATNIRRFPRRQATRTQALDRAATTYFSRRLRALGTPERSLLMAMIMFLDEGREDDLTEIFLRVAAILQEKKGA